MPYYSLETEKMQAMLNSVGAVVGDVKVFINSRWVNPLAKAPWSECPERILLPPILQELQGEWPCIPFGITKPLDLFSKEWTNGKNIELDTLIDNLFPHGMTSNNEWTVSEQTENSIRLSLDYPKCSAINAIDRVISLDDESLSLKISLFVDVHRNIELPIGLHPIFSLSEQVGATEISVGDYSFGRTYPIQFEPSSRLKVDTEFTDLSAVPTSDGDEESLLYFPLDNNREELVQLFETNGEVKIKRHDEQFESILRWDKSIFPSLCLWISNRGRSDYPWNSRYLALGVEPTASFFDLNPSIGGGVNNPLTRKKIKCLHKFVSGSDNPIHYLIQFKSLV
jgi:hypothetical protein